MYIYKLKQEIYAFKIGSGPFGPAQMPSIFHVIS